MPIIKSIITLTSLLFHKIRFKAGPVKEVIRNILSEMLTGKAYDSVNAKKWTIDIANKINEKVRGI